MLMLYNFHNLGLFAGCFMALFTGYCIMAHLAGMYTSHSNSIYMETAYPVLRYIHIYIHAIEISHVSIRLKKYMVLTLSSPFWNCSMFSLLFLHLFLYGCNIFMWRKARINYTFIFEFSPTKELKYREVFLICTACMTVVVGAMFAHLALVLKGNSSTQVQAIPGILVLVCF